MFYFSGLELILFSLLKVLAKQLNYSIIKQMISNKRGNSVLLAILNVVEIFMKNLDN